MEQKKTFFENMVGIREEPARFGPCSTAMTFFDCQFLRKLMSSSQGSYPTRKSSKGEFVSTLQNFPLNKCYVVFFFHFLKYFPFECEKLICSFRIINNYFFFS